MTKTLNVGISPSLNCRVREMKLALQGCEGGNMPRRVRVGETCPTDIGRGKHALVRLG